jgi:starch-binding outer membrane protein, SusD/RagB family
MKKIKFVLSLLVLCLATACDKNQLELSNPNEIQATEFWKTEKQALQGVLGVYDGLQNAEIGGARYAQLDVLTDNMNTNTNSETWLDIRNYAFSSSTTRVINIWRSLYTIVNRANVTIANLNAMPSTAISDAVKTRLLAEVLFLRAFAYHDLTLIYQGVPFYTKPNTTLSEGIAPTKGSEIAKAMIEDLKTSVIPNLPVSTSDGRISKGAATFLLGKFYMDLKDYPNGLETLKSLKSAPYTYSLFSDYERLFTPEVEFANSEVMFQVNFIDSPLDNDGTFGYKVDTLTSPSVTPFAVPRNIYSVLGGLSNSYLCTDGKPFTVVGTTPHPIYGAKSTLASTTSIALNRDKRMKGSIFSNLDNTPGGKKLWNYTGNAVGIKKYFHISPIVYNSNPQNYYMMRYADALLMLAEAEVEVNPADPDIFANVKLIRDRAGVAMFTQAAWDLLTTNQKRTLIRDERRWEFAFEHVRFFDLRRWGVAYSKPLLYAANTAIPATTPDILFEQWPYPLPELDNNPALKKAGNPGY